MAERGTMTRRREKRRRGIKTDEKVERINQAILFAALSLHSAHADLSSFFSPNVPFRWLNGGTVLLSCPVTVLLSRVRNEIMQKDVAAGVRGNYIGVLHT